MLLKNAWVFTPEFTFEQLHVQLQGDRIVDVRQEAPDQPGEDLTGCFLIPGLIDIHTHGCVGWDASDGDLEGLQAMSEFYARHGVTSFLATSMSQPVSTLERVFAQIRAFRQEGPRGARCLGIHMEGPFFSKEKCGAQDPSVLLAPDAAVYRRLQEISGNCIRQVDFAPELPGAMEFIEALKGEVPLSLAHTNADYDTAIQAMDLGVNHVTHLFNGMTGISHRAPGVAGAAMDRDVTAELICDGIHIHPAVIRMVFRAKGPDRVNLISDSMSAAGMPDGTYHLGGQKVNVQGGRATLDNGALAGSTTNLLACVQNVISFGVPAEHAIQAATYNPAREIGVLDDLGTIETGKFADLVVLDEHWNLKQVYLRGKAIL